MSQPAEFQEHIGRLRVFLDRRAEITQGIEALLHAQRTAPPLLQSPTLLSRQFEDCFCADSGRAGLWGQLEAGYWAAGFQPRKVQHLYNDLNHPVEILQRALHCWRQTRWPGPSDRLHFAHTLFNLYVLRALELLSLRIWDAGPAGAGERLAELQARLDDLWRDSPPGQPVLVRDARWLIPLAQSLITDALAPYFTVARLVRDALPEADAREVQRAHVRMLGGHLTSQIRHYCTQDGVPMGDRSVVLRTRTSNALDLALLVQGLVALLRAYDSSARSGDERTRLAMAGAIFQGISPDPELFLHHTALLRAYSMIELVFLDGGADAYSPLGQTHLRLLADYDALMSRLSAALAEDLPRFRPVAGGCSPFGVLFGLPSNLLEHMALRAMQRDAEARFSLEDVFDDTASPARLAWVNGWRNLPHVPREIQRQFAYPQPFAEEVYRRIENELRGGRAGGSLGRLHLGATALEIPELPARFFQSSDRQLVAANRAEFCERAQLLAWRQEAHFLVSYETPGGWMALRKDLLTEVLGAGRDARITGLPPGAARALPLMCPGLVLAPSGAIVRA